MLRLTRREVLKGTGVLALAKLARLDIPELEAEAEPEVEPEAPLPAGVDRVSRPSVVFPILLRDGSFGTIGPGTWIITNGGHVAADRLSVTNCLDSGLFHIDGKLLHTGPMIEFDVRAYNPGLEDATAFYHAFRLDLPVTIVRIERTGIVMTIRQCHVRITWQDIDGTLMMTGTSYNVPTWSLEETA